MFVITVSGAARHGKNTFCEILQKKLNEHYIKSLIINYADYLKYLAKQYYNWNGEKDEVGRSLLQNLGTEKIRSKNPDFWVNNVINLAKVLKDDFDFFLIGDCRFKNEIYRWIEEGYEVISVHIERLNFHNGLTTEQRNHLSERDLDNYKFDYYVKVENLKQLEEQVDEFITMLQQEGVI